MRLTAFVASLAVVAGLTLAPAVSTAAAEPVDPVGSPSDKIATDLQDRFHTEPVSDFWVTFGAKADLEPAKKIADWTERGQFVYDALSEAAETSVSAVAGKLDKAGVSYTSYPIANAVLVKGGTEKLALDVAAVTEVAELQPTPQAALVEPVDKPAPEDHGVRPDAADEETITWGLEAIHAPEAWAMGARGSGITVANLDSGVQFDHPALVNAYRGNNGDGTFDHDYNWMATRGDCSATPCDDNGHGTHTMGTMVGADGTHKIGVAPDAQWIATDGCCESTGVETLLDSGWWLLAPTDLEGNNPDVSRRPQVINNSWGQNAEGNFDNFFRPIDEAWAAAGIFSVWSSGNTSPYAACDTVSSPGAAPSAYSVGAYASNGNLASFSRKGEGEDGRIKPEISAPGVAVESSVPGDGYASMSGTSMASPHVAGAVAALWSYDPTLVGQIEQTRMLLGESAVDVDDTECGGTADINNKYGEGRLDLKRLLELAPREGGTLTGVVTDNGTPVKAAEVSISGPFNRSIGTDDDGRFTMNLPVGDYHVSTKVFGYLTATADVTITLGQDTAVTIALTAASRHDVTGRILDEQRQPVPNADVSVKDTPLPAVRTDSDGAFTIADVPEGSYTLAATPNSCFAPTAIPLTVGAEPVTPEIEVALVVDKGGYSCVVSEGDYLRGTDKVEWGTGVWAAVDLPFPVALYNGSHETLQIGKRGVVGPDNSTGPGSGGAGVFPFWQQTPVQFADGGGVFTGATTVDGEDAFVVEYRDVKEWAYPIRSEYTEPVNFSVTFTRSGTVIVGYGDGVGTDDPVTAGVRAVTGIQGWAGVDGIRFSEYAPILHDGLIVTYHLPAWGTLDATVVDQNDGQPVAGAEVTFTDSDGFVESVTTGPSGLVHRQLPVGDYTMTVEAENYVTAPYDFSFGELFDKETIDVRLKTPVAALEADSLDTVLGTDQNGVGTLTLTNTGSAPLNYQLGEAGRHPEFDTGGATERTGAGADSTIDLTAWKTEKAGTEPEFEPSNADGDAAMVDVAAAKAADTIGTMSGGDVITRIGIPGEISEKEPTGVGYDGDVWVHDYTERINTAYTVTGTPTGKVFDAAWNPDYRAFDLELDTRTGDMCQIEDSPRSVIHCFDTDTGEKTRVIKGEWSTVQLTGLAYNPTRDVFYVGGRRNGSIATVAGTSWDTPGEFLSYCAAPKPEVMGLAYNPASDTIWYSDLSEGDPTRLIQVDPTTCQLVNAWWFPGMAPRLGGGLATDVSGALWAVDQIADDVLLVDVEDDLLTDLPWLSLSSTEGTLAPGASTTVDVSVSSADADPGVAAANIVVMSDSGRQSKAYVPVTLTTTPYQVGVNAGGSSFTDGAGFTWSADQPAGDGTWGYQGEDKVTATAAAIDGTTDDTLFQSQRTTPSKSLTYTFADAPKGTYAVDLGFAEIEKVGEVKRVFDVLVDGSLAEYAYNPAAAGANTADWLTTVVQHDGGPLTVELRGARGLRAPSLAALRVTLDPRTAESDPGPEPQEPEPGEVPVAPAGRSYTLTETEGLYRQGTLQTGWTGNNFCGVWWFDESFLFPFYDTSWDGVCIGSNGSLIFDRSSSLGNNTALPSRSPFDAIRPLWDDLTIDADADIYLGTAEVDGLAAKVIEWRNVAFNSDPTVRVSFSVTLVADGRIQIGYGDGIGGENPLTRGSSATVGVESLQGNPVAQYSFNEPVLTAGLGLEYSLPMSGTIEGTVTDANDDKPIAGAIITLTSSTGERVITADEWGRWKAQALIGESTVAVSSPNYVTDSHPVTITEKDQAEVLDSALATGIATVDADLEWFLGPDQTATKKVTVTNTGSAPLEVHLSEQQRTDGGHQPADLPWIALTGAAATGTVVVPVGDSTTVMATVDNTGVEPGVLDADVLVASNDGKGENAYQPVVLATSAYWQGVDAGGTGFSGVSGDADFDWAADQALGSGPWGYVGGTVDKTGAAIAGTEDDALLQTQRTGRGFSYVFSDAPAGTYRIGLDFAEIGHARAGARAFDVLVDGEAVLYHHDVAAAVGATTLDQQAVTIEHAGGDLTVEFKRLTSKRDPIINALRIQEDPRLGK